MFSQGVRRDLAADGRMDGVPIPPTAGRFVIALGDPPTSDHLVFLIEDGGLAGGDRALGLVEEGVDGFGVYAGEGGHGRGVAMADLDADADWFRQLGDRDPVEAVGEEVAGEEIFV